MQQKMDRNSFIYYDGIDRVTPHWNEGVVVPNSKAASAAKFLLDQTDHYVLSKTYEHKIEYVQVDLNRVENALAAIIKSQHHMRWILNRELDRIVMGRDMWEEVVDKMVQRGIDFTTQMRLGYQGEMFIHSVPVQVLPNITGYLVLPKMQIEYEDRRYV